MMIKKYYPRITSALLAMTLFACGDGGSGGGSPETGINYTGSRTLAQLDGTNSPQWVERIFNAEDDANSDIITPVGPAAPASTLSGPSGLAKYVQNKLAAHNSGFKGINGISSSASEPCLFGGTETFTASETSGRLTFNNCRDVENTTQNGSILISTDGGTTPTYLKLTLLDLHVVIVDLTTPAPHDVIDDFRWSGSYTFNLTTDPWTVSMDITFTDENGHTIYLNNFYVNRTDNGDGTYSESLGGRVYHSLHGYIDIETTESFVYVSSSGQLKSGKMVISGDNTKIETFVDDSITPLTPVKIIVSQIDPSEVLCTSPAIHWSDLETGNWICNP